MTSPFIGVYKALYDYDANTEEELSITAGDLLYLLQKSDIDDWWTVKKRLTPEDGDADEPSGLLPSNYIEPAPVVAQCEALYDYDKQTEEELSFKEGETFELYDLADPDWLLAGNKQLYGFIPSNYIKYVEAGAAPAAISAPALQPQTTSASTVRPVTQFAPPPVHKDRVAQQQAEAEAARAKESEYLDVEGNSEDEAYSAGAHQQNRNFLNGTVEHTRQPQIQREVSDDEAPPPMPTRPGGRAEVLTPTPYRDNNASAAASTPARASSYAESASLPSGQETHEHGFDGEFFRWYIDEVDGRKKRPVVLAIGNGLIILKPNSTNPKKLRLRSASSLDNNWRIRDLSNYNHEKKHVFLELHNPDASIELHAGSKDVAEAIVSVLGDLKGAETALGLKEVARAALTKTSESNKRVGKLLYDFKAQGNDELLCRESDEVYIVDLTKSKEWWLCERVGDGRQGVIPSSYIEIVATTNLDKLTDGVERRKSQKSSKGKVVGNAREQQRKLYHSRNDRDKIRESDKKKRDTADAGEGENMPNFHRVRTWIDSSGTFKVEAEFLGCMEGKVHLHKTNGVKIAVGATKLSIEDLEYVEKVTGTSLQKYKDEVEKQMRKRDKAKSAATEQKSVSVAPKQPEVSPQVSPAKTPSKTPVKTPTRSATAVINDVPPQKPERKASASLPSGEPEYDWFDFFLSCGVDIGNCQRYSINFSREQMDESVLEDITPSLLRSLGLREGDILRVMKHLDTKFDRKKSVPAEAPAQGGLFTEPTGALKNNSTTELLKVNASALPTPSPAKKEQAPVQKEDQSRIEDEAWAVRPAARSTESLPRPQYTGSLQDLVDVKPLEASKSVQPAVPALASVETTPSAPPMAPVKTGTSTQPTQQFAVQKTGAESTLPAAVGANKTGGLIPVRTGGLIPIQTGGLIPVQPTGFMPITAQPTGFVPIQATGAFMPIQATGFLGAQPTFGFVPLQTGATTFAPQKTAPSLVPPPVTSFGQVPMQPTASFVPLQPGNLTQPLGMPLTSFGQQPTGGQPFGGAMRSQTTGGLIQNAFVPQSTFGRQITGGFMASNQTGGMPQTSFGQQATGGAFPQTSFGQQATGGAFPQTSFGQQPTGGQFPPTSFGQQATGGLPPTSFGSQFTGNFGATQQPNAGVNQVTNMFQNASLTGQQGQFYGQQPPNSFGQPTGPALFGQQTNMYGQQQTNAFGQQPQTSFGQQPTGSFGQQPPTSFGQQPTGTFGQQPPTSFGQQPTGSFGQPATSFGQPSFEGFSNQPLQSQPTGLGFGNAPNLQSQPTGRRANLHAATADNPFGF